MYRRAMVWHATGIERKSRRGPQSGCRDLGRSLVA